MATTFQPASRKKTRLRLAIDGPSGAGKTFTALRFAFGLVGEGGRVAVIDTESGSASKYAGESPDGIPWEFDVLELDNHAPTAYRDAILAAGKAGYEVLIVDSLSHAWAGSGGALEQVDKRSGETLGKFGAWRDVTPMHNGMVEAILRSPCHVIATLRTKMEYVPERDDHSGKTVIRKLGMAPVQRQGIEYEFDIVADMDQFHTLTVSKSRCSAVDGHIVVKPNASFVAVVKEWLTDGVPAPEGHYTASEEDLTQHAQRLADAQRKGKPRKSAQDLLNEQLAAKQAAATKAKEAAEAPSTNGEGNDSSPRATADQVKRLEGYFTRLFADPKDAMEAALKNRGVTALRQLTFDQAEQLLGKLIERELTPSEDSEPEEDTPVPAELQDSDIPY